MALTRKLLKGMGLTDEQVDTIIEAHTDTVDGLKNDIARYKTDAEKLPGVQQELDTLKAAGDGGWQEKYNTVKKEFDNYKQDVTNRESAAAKERAVRAYYESKGITGKSLDIAMRGSSQEIAALEMDGENLKDTKVLDDLVAGTFSGLVSTTETRGANTSTPPGNSGNSLTREDIFKKDDKGRYVMSTEERQKAIAENHELFGF